MIRSKSKWSQARNCQHLFVVKNGFHICYFICVEFDPKVKEHILSYLDFSRQTNSLRNSSSALNLCLDNEEATDHSGRTV
jgi:hypothetical protein